MEGTITVCFIALCITVFKIYNLYNQRQANKVQLFHCPECRKYYPGEWEDERVPVYLEDTQGDKL